jgi:hypothetical protein
MSRLFRKWDSDRARGLDQLSFGHLARVVAGVKATSVLRDRVADRVDARSRRRRVVSRGGNYLNETGGPISEPLIGMAPGPNRETLLCFAEIGSDSHAGSWNPKLPAHTLP